MNSEISLFLSDIFHGVFNMISLSPDEAALIKAILTALRGIKVRDIDKALVILSKNNQQQ